MLVRGKIVSPALGVTAINDIRVVEQVSQEPFIERHKCPRLGKEKLLK